MKLMPPLVNFFGLDRIKRAIAAGVPIAAGSDMYYSVPGRTRGEASLQNLQAYLDSGMTPIQVIQSATIRAAELLGMERNIGTLEAGRFADIIAVPGDPAHDATQLLHVQFVMKDGVVIRGPQNED
jgi:imidazolonepropionase-like amidohydrolase